MAVFIECSSCHRKLRVRSELVGKSVRCPNCKTKFLAAQVEGLSAPSGEGGPATAEGGSTVESHEAVIPPDAPTAGKEDSSGPTVRRPVAAPPATMPTSIPVPPEAITAHPPEPAAAPRPPAIAREGGARVPETPWAQVSLVLGLVLLTVVLIGLLGAWWVSAGMHAARDRRGAPARVGVLPRPALFALHPFGASPRAWRPRPTLGVSRLPQQC